MKATPVAQSSPRLPKTMLCTLTAVPSSAEIPSIFRYSRARGLFQLAKTAPMAPQSCSCGSWGNGLPQRSSISALKSSATPRSDSAVSPASLAAP